jgi:hypothetical protein
MSALGPPLHSPGLWAVNYVQHGVIRFKEPEWAYAKRFPAGAMVGYSQSMEPQDIHSEVNEERSKTAISALTFNGSRNPGGINRYSRVLTRPFEISPFYAASPMGMCLRWRRCTWHLSA